jgi:RNA polymerase sigma-70 factor, ECF subfamily
MPELLKSEVKMDIQSIEADDFDWIVLQHQKRIFRVLLFLVRDADTAETLTQECFLMAFRKRESFRGESGLVTWLVSIAINLARDHGRNRRWAFWRRLAYADRIETIGGRDVRRSPEQAVLDNELLDAVQSAVDRLTEKQRIIFQLRFIEELSLDEIATVTGLEIGTVKTHLFRAVRAVRCACGK